MPIERSRVWWCFIPSPSIHISHTRLNRMCIENGFFTDQKESNNQSIKRSVISELNLWRVPYTVNVVWGCEKSAHIPSTNTLACVVHCGFFHIINFVYFESNSVNKTDRESYSASLSFCVLLLRPNPLYQYKQARKWKFHIILIVNKNFICTLSRRWTNFIIYLYLIIFQGRANICTRAIHPSIFSCVHSARNPLGRKKLQLNSLLTRTTTRNVLLFCVCEVKIRD